MKVRARLSLSRLTPTPLQSLSSQFSQNMTDIRPSKMVGQNLDADEDED